MADRFVKVRSDVPGGRPRDEGDIVPSGLPPRCHLPKGFKADEGTHPEARWLEGV